MVRTFFSWSYSCCTFSSTTRSSPPTGNVENNAVRHCVWHDGFYRSGERIRLCDMCYFSCRGGLWVKALCDRSED